MVTDNEANVALPPEPYLPLNVFQSVDEIYPLVVELDCVMVIVFDGKLPEDTNTPVPVPPCVNVKLAAGV